MIYKVVQHGFAVTIDDPDSEAMAFVWCIEAPDGQLFTLMGLSPAPVPAEAPEALNDLAAALNAGRSLRLGLPIVGLTA